MVRPVAVTGAQAAVPRAPEPTVHAAVSAEAVPNVFVADPRAKIEIDTLLRQMVSKGASDLHLRVGEPPVLRLHGEMAAWFAERNLVAHVTVTDETDYVASFVVVETAPAAAAGVAT